jgi:purine-cytosine permease-like protein
VGNVIVNIYSSALSIQLLGKHFIAVPRFVWCTLLSAVTFALAYGGRNVLEEIINNLLSVLGYWTLAFAEILFIEHFWFRPRLGGYDLSAWQDQKRMPWGLAGTGSLLIGIGFSFLGMAQTWVSRLLFLIYSSTNVVLVHRSCCKEDWPIWRRRGR